MIELVNTAIVVVAQQHNPTILHPAFLEAQEIVPKGWEYQEDLLCTPAVSVVKYANGITFTVEGNRLAVTEEKPAGNPLDSKVAGLAVAYVEKLPHVRYTAVGVNFTGYLLHQEPAPFLIGRFLKAGDWNDQVRPMKGLGVRFVYHVEDALLRFGVDEGYVEQQEAERQPAILINGNFHSELPDTKPIDTLRALAGRWSRRLGEFLGLSRVVLGLEECE
jgi:hypothetical protein